MTTDERIDRLEEKIEKLQADYAILKYIIEKESFADQLVKIFTHNASQRLPELIEVMKNANDILEKKNDDEIP